MSRQNKKERQRLKRKQKQLKLRKESGLSVFQRLARMGGPMRCSITPNWKSIGEASLIVVRDAPGAGKVLLGFLIDFWCVGLKDAYGREDISLAEIEAHRDRTGSVPIAESEARRLIAGAIRFSRRNGFKLPHKYERFAAAAGVTPADAENADLSDFGMEGGKLRYVGSIAELRRKLAGSLEDFMARPDIEFVMSPAGMGSFDDEFYDEEEDSDESDIEAIGDQAAEDDSDVPAEFAQMMEEIAARAEAAVRAWLVEQGQTPHPRLADGIDVALGGAMFRWAAEEAPEGDAGLPDLPALVAGYDDPEDVARAVDQVVEFVRQYQSPGRFIEALMPDEEEEAPAKT